MENHGRERFSREAHKIDNSDDVQNCVKISGCTLVRLNLDGDYDRAIFLPAVEHSAKIWQKIR